MILVDVYQGTGIVDGAIEALYELLKERSPETNISHREMPTFEQHRQFVYRRPYEAWYLIQDWPETYEQAVFDGKRAAIVGSIYLTRAREIGIFIFKVHQRQGYGAAALEGLRRLHPGRILANINPANASSIAFFERHGARHIQNTYEL